MPEAAGIRDVADVETLKALADPLRLAILAALMQGPAAQPRVMSVKELATELGEPQTKLYRRADPRGRQPHGVRDPGAAVSGLPG